MTMYPLLPEAQCFSKSHRLGASTYLETYRSHVDCTTAYSNRISSRFHLGSAESLARMVELHDLGKRTEPFQGYIKNLRATGRRQPIRHETLTFLKWLEDAAELRGLHEWMALAILAHHLTLLDKEQAATIERHMIAEPGFDQMLEKWNRLRGTPWIDRIDYLLLRTLPLVDYLRTVDVLASYTSEVVFQRHMGGTPRQSIFSGRWAGDHAGELSCFNLRQDEIVTGPAREEGNMVSFQLIEPVKTRIEGTRWNAK